MDQNGKRCFSDRESPTDTARSSESPQPQNKKSKGREFESLVMTPKDIHFFNSGDVDSYVPDSVAEYALLYHSIYKEKLACFGMIHAAPAKILRQSGPDLSAGTSKAFPFKVRFQDESVFLDSSHESHQASQEGFAVLSCDTGRVLFDIRKLGPIYFNFHLLADDIMGSPQNRREKNAYIMLNIVIFGSKSFGVDIGELLSSKRLYLQHPGPLEECIEYDNPHFLRFDSLFSTTAEAAHVEYASIGTSTNLLSVAPIAEQSDDEAILQPRSQVKVTKILDSLTRSKNLKRIVADIRINTPLLRHQEEALDFIAQREFGPVPDEYSLWTQNLQGSEVYYCHRISGHKLREPPVEVGGGILADDMGLGKTLTMIANILRTGKRAKKFAESGSQNQMQETGVNFKVSSRSTLVIVQSASLIDGWIEETNKHCHGHININVYHGRGRETNRDVLADSDIVFSTYDTIALEATDHESPVYCIIWFRIILDEAHRIRNTTTKLFRAMVSLSASIRWCVTGTPIQNRLEDLAALISFIGISPLDNVSVFRKQIAKPLRHDTEEGFRNLRILLDSICLRRTRALLEDIPKVQNIYRPICFSADERLLYSSTQRALILDTKQHDSFKRNQKGYFGVFQMLQQLRRLCNHGTFQREVSRISDTNIQFNPEAAFEFLKAKNDAKCHGCEVKVTGIDPDVSSHGRFSFCGHLFCFACALNYRDTIEAYDKSSYMCCPICTRRVEGRGIFVDNDESTHVLTHNVSPSVSKVFETTNGVSSKISAMLTDIKQNQTEGKSLIFSCWTTSLDLVGYHLSLHGLSFQRLDGNSPHSQRREILKEFVSDSTKRILIMTTGTGAEGLNLTVANFVYILEPQWNPMVEEQAIARASRMSQTRDVKVFRYVVQGTLEETELRGKKLICDFF